MSGNLYKDYRKVKFGFNKWKKNGRRPADVDNLRFTEVNPLILKNHVVGKGMGTSDLACIPEMMKLFDCLEKNDHHQYNCNAQVSVFQKCYNVFQANKKQRAMGKTATPVPGAKKLPTEQLNTLLRMYPQHFKE
ncbi:hypothetical protein HDE_02186 [Halotydeus destructor]|nr:hypothetical protein HDE_02186 [Halotydeus destructor]